MSNIEIPVYQRSERSSTVYGASLIERRFGRRRKCISLFTHNSGKTCWFEEYHTWDGMFSNPYTFIPNIINKNWSLIKHRQWKQTCPTRNINFYMFVFTGYRPFGGKVWWRHRELPDYWLSLSVWIWRGTHQGNLPPGHILLSYSTIVLHVNGGTDANKT